jgi:hypothetical protein
MTKRLRIDRPETPTPAPVCLPAPNGGNGERGKRDGRDRRGRFKPGSEGGPGRPPGRPWLARALANCVSPAEAQALIRSLYKRALAGNMTAARLVLERMAGPPISARTIVLPELGEALTAEQGLAVIVKAVAAGQVDVDTGKALASLLAPGSEPADLGGPSMPDEAFL